MVFVCSLLLTWTPSSLSAQLEPLELQDLRHEYSLTLPIEYLEDKSAALTLDDILQENDSALWALNKDTIPNHGYTKSAFWFKRTLSGEHLSATRSRWILEIHYSLLDEIDVYYVSNGKPIQHYSTGDSKPFYQRPIEHRHFLFPLTLEQHQQVTIYLRIKTEGSLRVPATLWGEQAFFDKEQHHLAWQGIFVGALLVMIFYNLALAFFTHEKAYYIYVFFIGTELLTLCQISGLNYQYLWPQSPHWNTLALPFLVALLMALGLTFVREFLNLKSELITHYRLTYIGSGIGLLLAVSSLFGPYSIMVRLNSICIGIAILYGMSLTLYCFFKGFRAARFVVVAWTVLLVSGFIYLANLNGLLPPNFFIANIVQLAGILEVALLSLAFGDRINFEKQAKLMAQKALVEVQRQANLYLEQTVKARTEELQQANQKLQEINTLDPLTQVKNRGYFNDNIDREYQRAIRTKSPLTLIMLDIDHFKQINDQYGHQIGDKAIIHIANILTELIRRPSDAIARYGGEEFAIILPDTDANGANIVAERIRATIEDTPLESEKGSIRITASLGYSTCLPGESESSNTMIAQADEALYAAKHKGRNRVIGKIG